MTIKIIHPSTRVPLELSAAGLKAPDGTLVALRDGAFRFAEAGNYSNSFGFQWNRFEKTQIDRMQENTHQSRERFFAATQWDKEDLSRQEILEVGSGAGRFTQVVLQCTNANLWSVDYSNAVEANYRNNGPHPRLHLFQASIYELPFYPHQFDKVFCFGVLQHTPDFKKSIQCLVEMVRPGGQLVIDFYPVRGWYTKLHAKYMLRPFTRRMDHSKLLALIERNVDWMMAAYRFFEKMGVGRLVNRFLPICDIARTLPPQLDKKTFREWVILDTFDMFSPAYDNPQRMNRVMDWFAEFGMAQVKGEVVKFSGRNEVTVVKGVK